MSADQHTMIQELEMLALLIAVSVWCPGHIGKRIVAFTDSESVRGSFLKTWSGNDPSSKLLRQIFLLEETHSCHVWLERVPSQSNPSDVLSRSQVAHWFGHERIRVDTTKLWEQSATCMGWKRAEVGRRNVRNPIGEKNESAARMVKIGHECWSLGTHRSMMNSQSIRMLSWRSHDRFLWDWAHLETKLPFEWCGVSFWFCELVNSFVRQCGFSVPVTSVTVASATTWTSWGWHVCMTFSICMSSGTTSLSTFISLKFISFKIFRPSFSSPTL